MAERNVCIVEDEPAVSEQLASYVHRADDNAHVLCFPTGEQLLLSGVHPDIVLMDIGLSGMDGIEAAVRMHNSQPDALCIFVTGRRESVFEAFDAHPFQYLLKPLDETDFRRVYEQARRHVERTAERSGGKLLVRTRNASVLLRAADVRYIESRSRKVLIRTADAAYETYGAIGRYETSLDERFYRSHRSFLVNLEHIRSYSHDRIRFDTGDEAFLTRKKYSAFVRRYMWYLQNTHAGL